MKWETVRDRRLALITVLVERASRQPLRRDAFVKLVYLLQVLRGVPLGYSFSLFSYGPSDSNVLFDLDCTVSRGAVHEDRVSSPDDYIYEVRPGPAADYVKGQAAPWQEQYVCGIDWVLQTFAGRSGKDLWFLTTLIYGDREHFARAEKISLKELVRLVRAIWPKFPEDDAIALAQAALAEGWLLSVVADPCTSPCALTSTPG